MTKNLGKYLNHQSGLLLLWTALFFGTWASPPFRWFSIPRCIVAEAGIGQITNWVLDRYDNLRFVYRITIQVTKLNVEQNARERQRCSRRTEDLKRAPNG